MTLALFSPVLIQNYEQPCEARGDSGTIAGLFPSLRNLPSSYTCKGQLRIRTQDRKLFSNEIPSK